VSDGGLTGFIPLVKPSLVALELQFFGVVPLTDAAASFTASDALRVEIRGLIRELMPLLAVGFESPLQPTESVLTVSHRLQVARVDASRYSAKVV
jgi:hypothetical protein